MSPKRASTVLLIVAILFGATGVAYYLIQRPAAPNRNVVLIVLDTLRADRLGSYGGSLGLTPSLDEFADQSIVFEQAYSQAPWTLPSHASLFTSRYPEQHGAGGRRGAFRKLEKGAVTIAEVFQDAGAATGAITNNIFLTNSFGTMQGFDTVDAEGREGNRDHRPAGPTTDAALQWIDEHAGGPFFLFVHYFDAHLLYEPPPEFRRRFADPRDRLSNDSIFGTLEDIFALRSGLVSIDEDTVQRLEKLYNAEVAYLDSEVGRLVQGIAQRGLDSETVIVVTSDHGEEFFDHGGFEHGHTLYDELLHVPLIILPPREDETRLRGGSSVDAVVRLVDVAPTLCEMAGLAPDPHFVGTSLVRLMKGDAEHLRPALGGATFSGPSGYAWRHDRMKLIRTLAATHVELYDIAADPGEQDDLAAQAPQRCAAMIEELETFLRDIDLGPADADTPSLTDDEIKKLKSLGYTG